MKVLYIPIVKKLIRSVISLAHLLVGGIDYLRGKNGSGFVLRTISKVFQLHARNTIACKCIRRDDKCGMEQILEHGMSTRLALNPVL